MMMVLMMRMKMLVMMKTMVLVMMLMMAMKMMVMVVVLVMILMMVIKSYFAIPGPLPARGDSSSDPPAQLHPRQLPGGGHGGLPR